MIWQWLKQFFSCPSCASFKRENLYLKRLNASLLAARGVMPPDDEEPEKEETEDGAEVVEQRFGAD